MVDRVEQEHIHKFIETVRAIHAGREQWVKLSEYWPREIADALQTLIDIAVCREREACAVVAEAAAEPSGAYARGETFAQDPKRRDICIEVAAIIRARR